MAERNDIEKWLDEGRRVPSDAEVEAAGRRFERRLLTYRRRRLWTLAGGVAAAVAGVAVAVSLLLPREESAIPTPVPVAERVADTVPVTVPTLILADGESLSLDEIAADTTVQQAAIQSAVRHISYLNGERRDTASPVRTPRYNTLVIPAGHTYSVTLADGSEVTLNAGSHLRYPVEFLGDTREVVLTGEAFFDVAKGERPFEVKVAGAAVRVYGTRFNVKLSKNDIIETVLVEGRVGFRTPGREEIRVVPGEQVTYRGASGEVATRRVDTRYATAWMEGVFRYSDRELDLVLDDISAWYGVKFVSDIDLQAIRLTMNLSKATPIDEVVSFIALMTDCQITKEKEVYVIKRE